MGMYKRRRPDALPIRWLMGIIDMLLMIVVLGILWTMGLQKPKRTMQSPPPLRRWVGRRLKSIPRI
ncbi:MAG: hypothetical protein Aurels2KO_55820 [Aureliella sp.]